MPDHGFRKAKGGKIRWDVEGEGTRVVLIKLEDGNCITVRDASKDADALVKTELAVTWETLGPNEEPEQGKAAMIAGQPANSVTLPVPETLISVVAEDGAEFHLHPDGTTSIEGDITPDEAAQRFWDGVGDRVKAHLDS